MLEFFLKYPPDQFRRGVVELTVSWEAFALLAAGIVLTVIWLLGYARLSRTANREPGLRARMLLSGIRAALLVLVVFALLGPRLVVPVEVPERARVAVLIDDTLSMRITDQDGSSRADFARAAFAPGAGVLARALEARFDTEYFRFVRHPARLRDGSELDFAGRGTDLLGALGRTAGASRDAPPAAMVVVTDGGGHAEHSPAAALARLRAAGIPVHVVGVGAERFPRDLEISAVQAPRDALAGDSIEAEVTIRYRGLENRAVELTVEDDGLLVARQELVLAPGRERMTARVEFDLEGSGPHELAFRLPLAPGETVVHNNEEHLVVNVRGEPMDVLHLEGEPRFEVKFTRRALAEDDHIRLVSLVHTADNKLYRLGAKTADELADGFPMRAEDLFPFRVVILGSMEASRLSPDQQRLLLEFVGRRGGGLLLLGGRRAFAEGSYADSPLAALMPVVLDARVAAFESGVTVEPTPRGLRHAVLRRLEDDLWARLPSLNVVNPIRRLKPGAELLLGGRDGDDRPLVVLASHRYGRGSVAAFAVRDTWRWQLHHRIPPADQTHEVLWRRLVRWLARGAEDRLRVAVPRHGAPGHPVRVAVDAVDPAYRPLGGATVRVTIDSPLGDRMTRDLDWQTALAGRYETRFTPDLAGRYDLEVSLLEGERVTAVAAAHVYAGDNGREYHRAELNAPLLRRIARETGGGYYPAADAGSLIDAITPPGSGRESVQRLPLWDAPLLYLLMVALASLEWLYRRRRRLR